MKPTTDLEARVMNRLQERKRGQSIQELAAYFKEPGSKILLVLAPYIKEGHVTKSKSGVWTVVRE